MNKYMNKHINHQEWEPAKSMSLPRGVTALKGMLPENWAWGDGRLREGMLLGAVMLTGALLWCMVQPIPYAKGYSSFSSLKMVWKRGLMGESK